ncbi:MAG: Acyl-CoA dehydrogenase C-terminal domain-containing protein [Bacteroidales bacterium]|nr:Acyl-CoA dehydrogenase C-terminal domain-containing protein [Bacteroidales bacterium]
MANFYLDNKDLQFQLSHPLMKKIVALKENDFADRDHFDYAPLDYEDAADTYQKVLEIVGEICETTIAPNAESVDHEGPQLINNEVQYARGTRENLDVLNQAGLLSMSLPRVYGGLNFPVTPFIMAEEIVSRADAGFANIWGLQDCAETINEFASEEVKKEFLPRFQYGATASMDLTEPDAGSDLQAVQLKAYFDQEKGVWLLNGVKRFITNGDADVALVLARSEEGTADARGLSLFVFDRKDGGMIVRRIENKLGIKGSPTCELVFKDAPAVLVGERRLGLIKYVMALMNSARLGIGAQSVGLSEAAYREALKYAGEREQFGKPIIQFPAVYEMLSVMKVKLQASRALLYETSRFVDMYKIYAEHSEHRKLEKEERDEMKYYQKLADVYTPMIKLISSEYCNQIAYDSIQIHGGAGFMKDFAVERLYRDARITSIYEGTSQLQVVSAIRGINTGIYLSKIREYESMPVSPDVEPLRKRLIDMTNEYELAVQKVHKVGDPEYTDFQARRLVEMAAHIIMGYLLLLDSERDQDFRDSARIFIRMAQSWNRERMLFIHQFDPNDLGIYKMNVMKP